MTNIVQLIYEAAKEREMTKERAVKAADFSCVAEIVITFSQNPTQLCIRFDKLSDAQKQFDKLNGATHKWRHVPAKFETVNTHTVHGPTMTMVVYLGNVDAIALVNRSAFDRMALNSQRVLQAMQGAV
jgi:hypothetical protein